MAGRFRYLNVGLGVVLGFVGVKMIMADVYHFPTWASLAVIVVVLAVAVGASLRADRRAGDEQVPSLETEDPP
jgi:tellurite resistance protein TerC